MTTKLCNLFFSLYKINIQAAGLSRFSSDNQCAFCDRIVRDYAPYQIFADHCHQQGVKTAHPTTTICKFPAFQLMPKQEYICLVRIPYTLNSRKKHTIKSKNHGNEDIEINYHEGERRLVFSFLGKKTTKSTKPSILLLLRNSHRVLPTTTGGAAIFLLHFLENWVSLIELILLRQVPKNPVKWALLFVPSSFFCCCGCINPSSSRSKTNEK